MPTYSVRYDGTELSHHAGITDAIHEWARRRAATIGSWSDQYDRFKIIEVTEFEFTPELPNIDAADLPSIGSMLTESLAIERRRLTGEPRTVHLQTTASDVRCGAVMRGQFHPDGWDLGNTSVDGLGVTCPACRGGAGADR